MIATETLGTAGLRHSSYHPGWQKTASAARAASFNSASRQEIKR
jgi:hypothetical protein